MPRALLLAAVLAAGPATSYAQQFVRENGWIPGTARWTEGVEPADVDNDGDLDLFFADGEGFSSPGTQRQNVLVINRLEIGVGNFADESVARLGVNLSHARGVASGDIQNDGWIDALFANGFNSDPPFLYVNRGASNPGSFLREDAARGLTESLSSASAQFGDVDNDGDLDAMICDSGNSYLGGSGAKTRLYFNDGAGFFSEAGPSGWNPPTKSAHMDVQLVDLDGDFDLDFFGPNRANNSGGNHYLMLNDGRGNYTDASSILPSSSSSVYEGDVADLDGDSDVDLFLVSIQSFSEGAMRNDFVPSGSLGFTKFVESSGDDDNEIAFLDYDNDGDLDPLVGSLGSTEKVFRNDGGMNFTELGNVIQSTNDSTLDLAVADVTGDGAYDIITAQGESNSAQWANKVYRNTGAADSIPPRILREETLPPLDDSEYVVRVHVQDQALDDGNDWITASGVYVINTSFQSGAIDVNAGAFSNASLNVNVGTTVTWTNQDAAAHSVVSSTALYPFDSGSLSPGGTFSYTFVSPGTYTYADAVGGAGVAQVVVSGTPSDAQVTYTGGGIRRFAMADTTGDLEAEICYEMRFVDIAGNTTVTTPRRVPICGFRKYDVGASPVNLIALSGSKPSLGQTAEIKSQNVPGAVVVTVLSFGKASIPYLGGVALVDPFLLYTVSADPVSGGTGTAFFPIPLNPNLAYVKAYFQSIAPDAGQPQGFALSNGLELTICE